MRVYGGDMADMAGYGGRYTAAGYSGIQQDTAGYSGIWGLQRDTAGCRAGYSRMQRDAKAAYSGI